MRLTLDSELQKVLRANQTDIINVPSQILCLAEMINFSENCAQAIKKGKLANYK